MKKFIKTIIIIFAFFSIGLTAVYIYLYPYYKVPILMYHALGPVKDVEIPIVDLDMFKKQMDYIKRNGYTVISLDDYCRTIKDGRRNKRKTVVITFDDGYKNNVEGLKYLRALDFPVTLFLPYWYLDKALPYPYEETESSKKINKDNYVNYHDISVLLNTSKLEIGSHTITHLYLVGQTQGIIKNEIVLSKSLLQNMLNTSVSSFSYPVGGFDRKMQEYIRETGYACAVTTNRGYSRDRDVYALRRVKVTNKDIGIRLFGKLSGYYNFFRKVKDPDG